MLTLSSENLLEITFETKPRRGLVARQLTSVAKEEDYLPPPPPPPVGGTPFTEPVHVLK